MSWTMCDRCHKWYRTEEFLSCSSTDCSNYTGKPVRAEGAAYIAPHGGVSPAPLVNKPAVRFHGGSDPQIRVVAPQVLRGVLRPAPQIHHAVEMHHPEPMLRMSTLHTASTTASSSTQQAVSTTPVSEGQCAICFDDVYRLDFQFPCCSARLCADCAQRLDAVVQNTGNSLRCAMPSCFVEVRDPKKYIGKLHNALVESIQSILQAFEKGKSSSSSASLTPQQMAWAGIVPCPHCHYIETGYGEGCDILTCPKCRKQYNGIDGSSSMRGMEHSHNLQDFYALIAATNDRS
jgi:hypothetical protein